MTRESRQFYAQERRQQKFPKDRIAFHPKRAYEDGIFLDEWDDSKHTIYDFEKLCVHIAYNNYLDMYFPNGRIPEGLMLNELKILGRCSQIGRP